MVRRDCLCIGVMVWCMVGSGVWAEDAALPPGPVRIVPPGPVAPSADYRWDTSVGPVIGQSDAEGQVWSWGGVTMEGGQAVFKPSPFPLDDPKAGVQVSRAGEGRIEVRIDGKLFTCLHYEKDRPKPFLWPVIGPYGDPVTRAYPMQDVEGERKDHPHHQSVWSAWGEVYTDRCPGATNYWHLAKTPDLQDREVVRRIVRTVSGPVFGLIEMEVDWVAHNGQREFTELRTYKFYRGDADRRVIDVRNFFKFDDTDVTFADTKEGGILAIRIASSMDEIALDRKSPGKGHMTNSEGGRGAAECWGKPAHWCDYVGPVNGKTVGIAVLDDPRNMNHPPRWHIRDYGLFAVNPIAVRPFLRPGKHATVEEKKAYGQLPHTPKTWKKGESEKFDYRILIHKGDTDEAQVPGAWTLYTLTRPAVVR